MSREHLDILMNRAIDGAATPPEREELARAMQADPALRAEFEELKAAHSSTSVLFERLLLPSDFTERVMRKVQPDHVPTDADLTAIIEDSGLSLEPLPSPAQEPRHTAVLHRMNLATILSTVGALSAAAALLLAIGMLTGVIGGSRGEPQKDGGTTAGNPPPSGTRDQSQPRENPKPQVVPDPQPKSEVPKNEPTPPKKEEEEEDRKPVPPAKEEQIGPKEEPKKEETKGPDKADPKIDQPKTDEPAVEGPEKTSTPDNKQPEPKKEEKKQPDARVEEQPEKTGSTPEKTEPRIRGRLLSVMSGRAQLIDKEGKPVPDHNGKAWYLDDETDLREGMRLQISVNGTALFALAEGGNFAANKNTIFTLTADGVLLEAGALCVDFDGARHSIVVAFDNFSCAVKRGSILIEKKTRQKFVISQSLGESHVVSGDQHITLDGGCSLDIEVGKNLGQPKGAEVMLPSWCVKCRAEITMGRVEPLMAQSKYTNSEVRALRTEVDFFMAQPVSTETLTCFLKKAMEIPTLSAKNVVEMLKHIQDVLRGEPEIPVDAGVQIATWSFWNVKTVEDWKRNYVECLRKFKKGDGPKKEDGARKEQDEHKKEERRDGMSKKDGENEIPKGK